MLDHHKSGRHVPPKPPAPLVFHIQEPDQAGYHFHYHRETWPEYVIGRVARGRGFDDVQVQLRDPRVSRRHCRVYWHVMYGWMIEDLGSANGTTVTFAGILPVRPHKVIRPFPIALGAIIRAGRSQLTVSEYRIDAEENDERDVLADFRGCSPLESAPPPVDHSLMVMARLNRNHSSGAF